MRDSIKRIEMRLRAVMPASIRRAYRRVLPVKKFVPPPPLTREQVHDCRVFTSRYQLLEALPPGGVVAELGTFRGDFAREIVRVTMPKELHLVDITFFNFGDTGLTGSTVRRHVGLTHDVIGKFPDSYFDWIYIDADHSFDGCMRDAIASEPKLKPGGYLIFNDFAHIDPYYGRYGVMRAAMTFAVERAWPMAFFALEPHGLHDVAFRKPG